MRETRASLVLASVYFALPRQQVTRQNVGRGGIGRGRSGKVTKRYRVRRLTIEARSLLYSGMYLESGLTMTDWAGHCVSCPGRTRLHQFARAAGLAGETNRPSTRRQMRACVLSQLSSRFCRYMYQSDGLLRCKYGLLLLASLSLAPDLS